MDRLISEQAVIDSIEFFQMNPQHFDFVNLTDDIKEIPSAEPQTGHWIDLDEKSAVCSCCYRNNTLFGDYCKWCGAKMVEPQESEG